MSYYVNRYYFRYGRETDPIDCKQSRDFPSFEKALAHGHRYAFGIRFAAFEVCDENGAVLYEETDEGVIIDHRNGEEWI